MNDFFDDLDRLDLDAHVRRWSAPDVGRAGGSVNEWIAAAQQFAARVQEDPGGLTDEQWRATAGAWRSLLTAAERATGPQRGEWLMRDLWLRSWLLRTLRPREDIPLLDPGPVLEQALDALPMGPEEAAELAPRWRELDRPRILALRTIRLRLAPVRVLAPYLADHPRWGEYETWEQLIGELP
ncbi:hypothetical protein ACFS5L_24835 [Streptomyces phyllanthi]|uniref:Uncharacterized protein n=1 Tax=Streptomyces phyllanthi TaxID=1803180 RepID=A0A5N8W587_9ACTN|nr:hypothetical protein [Streptomyces phyllanthi]MPY41484.1 hypothetical protein [Streptomyces phyllanthi]